MAKLGTSPLTLGNVLKHEYGQDHGYCREEGIVNVASATDLKVGSVLGKVTATGKYVPSDPAAVDGSQVAAAMVMADVSVPATTDTEVTLLVRGAAIVTAKGLVFDVAHDATQTATAHAELEALGILVR